MDENELYKEYEGICVPEDEYKYLVENEYISGDLQDMFVGSFYASKDDICQRDNELVNKIDQYLSKKGAIFIHDTKGKGVLEESRAFFFLDEFFVVVPINAVQEVTEYDEDTVKIRYTKSNKKPVCIPLKNIKEIHISDITKKTYLSMTFFYKNNSKKSDSLFLGGDVRQYSDCIYEYKNYSGLLDILDNKMDKAIDYMLMEDLLMDSFENIPADTFKYIKYDTVSSADFSMINEILEYAEHLKLDTKLYNIIDDYVDVLENYIMYKNEYENAKMEYENASFFRKGYWRKEVEINKDCMERMESTTELEAINAVDYIKEWVEDVSKEMKNKESSSNS